MAWSVADPFPPLPPKAREMLAIYAVADEARPSQANIVGDPIRSVPLPPRSASPRLEAALWPGPCRTWGGAAAAMQSDQDAARPGNCLQTHRDEKIRSSAPFLPPVPGARTGRHQERTNLRTHGSHVKDQPQRLKQTILRQHRSSRETRLRMLRNLGAHAMAMPLA
jgi:hypothetical protein